MSRAAMDSVWLPAFCLFGQSTIAAVWTRRCNEASSARPRAKGFLQGVPEKQTIRNAGRMTSVIHGYCTLCRSRCGTLNTLGSDQLLSVEPDPSHPTGKAMCME